MTWLMKLGILLIVPRHLLRCVQAVVLNQANKVLLLEHVFHPYAPWGPSPRWLMNRHEDPRRAVIRNYMTETGLLGEVGPPLHVERVPQRAHQLYDGLSLLELTAGTCPEAVKYYQPAGMILPIYPIGMYGFNYDAILAAQRLLQGEPEFEQIEVEVTEMSRRNSPGLGQCVDRSRLIVVLVMFLLSQAAAVWELSARTIRPVSRSPALTSVAMTLGTGRKASSVIVI